MDTVYGKGHNQYTIEPITAEDGKNSIEKAAISYLVKNGINVGRFTDTNVEKESLVLVCDRHSGGELQGIIACLWAGELLNKEGLRELYQDLIKKHASMDKAFENKRQADKLDNSSVQILDEERKKLHRQIVLIGIILGYAPVHSHYEIAAARGNLSEYDLPKIAVRQKDRGVTELFLPVFTISVEYPAASTSKAEPNWSGKSKQETCERLQKALKRKFKGRVACSIELFDIGHRYWAVSYYLPVIVVPTDILPHVVEFLKKRAPDLIAPTQKASSAGAAPLMAREEPLLLHTEFFALQNTQTIINTILNQA